MEVYFIHSAPRSGSTIFCKLLEQKKGYVVMPETYLPAALLSETFVLSIESINSCMPDGFPISTEDIFNYLSIRDKRFDAFIELLRIKFEPEFLVLKSTRLVSFFLKKESDIKINHIWITRNPVNVYESLTRVPFGERNGSILRFSIWYCSFNAICKSAGYVNVDYKDEYNFVKDMPEGLIEKQSYSSAYHSKKNWHGNLNDDFKVDDNAKRSRVKYLKRGLLILSTSAIIIFTNILVRLRSKYDKMLIVKINEGAI